MPSTAEDIKASSANAKIGDALGRAADPAAAGAFKIKSLLQSESAHCKYKSLCLATYVFTASLVTPKQSSRDLRSSSLSYQLQHGSSGALLLRCRQYASLGQS